MDQRTILQPHPHEPLLLGNLRTALSVLYSLNILHHRHPSEDSVTSQRQAHDFLLRFQTRNIRRKLHSAEKRIQAGVSLQPAEAESEETSAGSGSTWLCCLTLLAFLSASAATSPNATSSPVQFAEALFAAQTLVHRLRRVKLVEAMDVELEPPTILTRSAGGTAQVDGPLLCQRYQEWIHLWQQHLPHSTLPFVFQNYHPQMAANMTIDEMEHRLKCEMTMLTLAGLMFDITLAFQLYRAESTSGGVGGGGTGTGTGTRTSMRPLIATLASALAVTTARLRFSPSSIPEPIPNTQPIVSMILHSLETIKGTLPSYNTTLNSSNLEEVHQWIAYVCLTVLPDALLAGSGSGGGAHGTMSMDPRCYAAVTTEVRTFGMTQVCQALVLDQQLNEPQHHQPRLLVFVFQLCQEWAKYAPIPIDLLRSTIPILRRVLNKDNHWHPEVLRTAMGFWIAVMEGGSLSVEQVLAASLLQKKQQQQQQQQLNKNKQSTKSKRRQQEALHERTTDHHLQDAHAEVQHRQQTALYLANETIGGVRQLLTHELHGVQYTDDEVSGEGPVGGMVACANACLPVLIRMDSSQSISSPQERLELIRSIGSGIQELCQSQSRMVRSFAADTLYNLHQVVMHVLSDPLSASNITNELANLLVDHLYNCAMSLALKCGYPADYFQDLTINNDEELENERNDVRDILRTLAGTTTTSSEDGAIFHSTAPAAAEFASEILSRLVHACSQPILQSSNHGAPRSFLFPETAIHTFSALARPCAARAKIYQNDSTTSGRDEETLLLALNILRSAGERLNTGFPHVSLSEILPLSRVYNLAVASLSPMLGALSSISTMEDKVVAAVANAIDAAIASLLTVPELVAPSSLRSTRYDIRGAMRTPGGEDHAACLALVRLVNQSREMSFIVLLAKPSIAVDLCELYQRLKVLEQERGRGVMHGKGVFPKSRRILLGVICQLEQHTQGKAGALQHLQHMLDCCVNQIAQLTNCGGLTTDVLYQAAEDTFDLASFDASIVRRFLDTQTASQCLDVLLTMGKFGYDHSSDFTVPPEMMVQWNRLRAAIFCLFATSENADLPTSAIQVIVSLTRAECEAINRQCSLGPASASSIFREDLIAEEVVPAGLFVHVVVRILDKGASQNMNLTRISNCVNVLWQCKDQIENVMLLRCPNPILEGSFEDPRPMIAEAWILAILHLKKPMSVYFSQGNDGLSDALSQKNGQDLTTAARRLVVGTCITCVRLLLYPSLGKTQEARASDPGPSVDGPNMLLTLEFFEAFFNLGPSMLQSAAMGLAEAVPVDLSSIQLYGTEPQTAGVAVIGAAIFRAAQGGLPPWAVESMPAIFSALYNGALNRDLDAFARVVQMSMSVRRLQDDASSFCGTVQPGELFSGRFFETMGDKAKATFLIQTIETAKDNSTLSWKRLKSTIKQACGGKKKDTDFRQRPGLTKLEALDRV